MACLPRRKVNPLQSHHPLGYGPNVDFFTYDEIVELVKKFKSSNEIKQSLEEEYKVPQVLVTKLLISL